MRGSAMRESVTDVRIILECLQEAYQMEGDMVRSGKNIHATMIYPFVRMLQEKCRDLTEEQIHKTLWKEYEISGADRMFVEYSGIRIVKKSLYRKWYVSCYLDKENVGQRLLMF